MNVFKLVSVSCTAVGTANTLKGPHGSAASTEQLSGITGNITFVLLKEASVGGCPHVGQVIG